MRKNNLKDDTENEFEQQRVYNCPIYPRGSKIYSNKGFVNIDEDSMRGFHWTCCIVKGK